METVIGQKLRESKWFTHSEMSIFCDVVESGSIVEHKHQEVTRYGIAIWTPSFEKSKNPEYLDIYTITETKGKFKVLACKLVDFWCDDNHQLRINNISDETEKALTEEVIRNQIIAAENSKRKWTDSEHFACYCRYGPIDTNVTVRKVKASKNKKAAPEEKILKEDQSNNVKATNKNGRAAPKKREVLHEEPNKDVPQTNKAAPKEKAKAAPKKKEIVKDDQKVQKKKPAASKSKANVDLPDENENKGHSKVAKTASKATKRQASAKEDEEINEPAKNEKTSTKRTLRAAKPETGSHTIDQNGGVENQPVVNKKRAPRAKKAEAAKGSEKTGEVPETISKPKRKPTALKAKVDPPADENEDKSRTKKTASKATKRQGTSKEEPVKNDKTTKRRAAKAETGDRNGDVDDQL